MSDKRATLAALLREDFAPLLADVDVSAAHVAPDGTLTLTRRGKRERIEAKADALAAAAFAASGEDPVRAVLTEKDGGVTARIDIVRASSGAHLYAEMRASAVGGLSVLEDSGLLPQHVPVEVASCLSGGGSMVVLGPSIYGAHQLAVAAAEAVADVASTFALTGRAVDKGRTPLDGKETSGLPPLETRGGVPTAILSAPDGEHLLDAASKSVAAGATFLLAVDLSLEELKALVAADLPVVLIAHLRAPALRLDLLGESAAIGLSAVVGFGPRGEPRLASLMGESLAAGPPSPGQYSAAASDLDTGPVPKRPASQSGESHAAPHVRPPVPVGEQAATARSALPTSPQIRTEAHAAELPPLKPLGPAPPSTWMSDAPEMDPGWDIKSDSALHIGHLRAGASADDGHRTSDRPEHSGSANLLDVESDDDDEASQSASVVSARGSFAETLQGVASRPTFQPRKPIEHPQAKTLRQAQSFRPNGDDADEEGGGDPFGGLTFEPPHQPTSGRSASSLDSEDDPS